MQGSKAQDYSPVIPAIISATMLILAIPPIWPYGYYMLLRLVVCACSAFLAFRSYALEKRIWTYMMVFVALLFNPIAPIYLQKETWVVIDVIAAVVFLISMVPL